jgi:hypothetical protein
VCDAVFSLRNGGVANTVEAGQQMVWADTNAAMAAAIDLRFGGLARHVATLKRELTTPDGRGYVEPGEFDPAVVVSEVQAAANECVRLESAGLVP